MPATVGVIGAGIAGLSAAKVLAGAGHIVRVFDKGRGPGGRTSTRRQEGRQFDHGCPAFAAVSAEFRDVVDGWMDAGVVSAVEEPGALAGVVGASDGAKVYTGVPGMNSIAAHMARGLSVRCGTGSGGGEIWRVSRDGAQWRLYDKVGTGFDMAFDAVVVATPSPQAAQLLAFMPALAERLRAVAMAPTWTLMAEWAGEPGPDAPRCVMGDGGGGAGALAKVLLDSAKRAGPGRSAWVAHASEAWTREHLEREPAEVEPLLLEALRGMIGTAAPEAAPTFIKAHRWRYARVARPDAQAFALDAERRVGVCGDGFTTGVGGAAVFGTLESAYLSGAALGRQMAGVLAAGAAPAASG